MTKKRFIDNSILPKNFRKLDCQLKITYYWIWNQLDPAGVWHIDEDYFSFENNFELPLSEFQEHFSDLIQVTPDRILFLDYIRINYGHLRENYNPHKPVFRSIHKNNLIINSSYTQACFKLEEEEEEECEKEDEYVGVSPKGDQATPHSTHRPTTNDQRPTTKHPQLDKTASAFSVGEIRNITAYRQIDHFLHQLTPEQARYHQQQLTSYMDLKQATGQQVCNWRTWIDSKWSEQDYTTMLDKQIEEVKIDWKTA